MSIMVEGLSIKIDCSFNNSAPKNSWIVGTVRIVEIVGIATPIRIVRSVGVSRTVAIRIAPDVVEIGPWISGTSEVDAMELTTR
jgi:hypothetical protein